MICIADIADAVSGQFTQWHTLSDIQPELDAGRPKYVTGNAAVTFFVRHQGKRKVLKCYTRTNSHLPSIYRERYLRRELCVFDISGRQQWIDCLLMDCVEGITLDQALCADKNEGTLHILAEEFDRMAVELLSRDTAHGDLKPENIIVKSDMSMEAIDWDSAFMPKLAGDLSPEIGTAAYQHPERTRNLYDKHIDDYSIAMLTTLLHAAAADPSIAEHYSLHHEFALNPRSIAHGDTAELNRIIDLFAARGMARQYRIARMLTSVIPQLLNLAPTLNICNDTKDCTVTTDTEPLAQQLDGLWGCKQGSRWVAPPLYDWAFDPTQGVMLVGLGGYSHFVTTDARTLMNFDKGDIVKPFRNGQAKVRHSDGKEHIVDINDLNISDYHS